MYRQRERESERKRRWVPLVFYRLEFANRSADGTCVCRKVAQHRGYCRRWSFPLWVWTNAGVYTTMSCPITRYAPGTPRRAARIRARSESKWQNVVTSRSTQS